MWNDDNVTWYVYQILPWGTAEVARGLSKKRAERYASRLRAQDGGRYVVTSSPR